MTDESKKQQGIQNLSNAIERPPKQENQCTNKVKNYLNAALYIEKNKKNVTICIWSGEKKKKKRE